jgi:uncharacterized protein (TIGR00251 family)
VNPPFSRDGDDILLAIRLTPRARRDEIGALVDAGDGRSVLAVRIAAPPVEGAANKALIALLARTLAIPRSAVTIESGETSRLKRVRLNGVSEARLQALLH